MKIVIFLTLALVAFFATIVCVVVKSFSKNGRERAKYLTISLLKLALVVLGVGFAIVFVIDNFDIISESAYMIFHKEQIAEFRVFLKTVFGTRSVFVALQVMLCIVYCVLSFIFISLFSFVVAISTQRLCYKILTVEKVFSGENVVVKNEKLPSKIFLMTSKLRL